MVSHSSVIAGCCSEHVYPNQASCERTAEQLFVWKTHFTFSVRIGQNLAAFERQHNDISKCVQNKIGKGQTLTIAFLVSFLSEQLNILISAGRNGVSYALCNSLLVISRHQLYKYSPCVSFAHLLSPPHLELSIYSFSMNNGARRISDGKIMVS